MTDCAYDLLGFLDKGDSVLVRVGERWVESVVLSLPGGDIYHHFGQDYAVFRTVPGDAEVRVHRSATEDVRRLP